MFNPVTIQRTLQKIPLSTLHQVAFWVLIAITACIAAALAGSSINQYLSANTLVLEFEGYKDRIGSDDGSTSLAEKLDYTTIGTKPLIALVPPSQATTAEPVAKKTNLPLTLVGTFVEDKKSPYAIIEEQKRSTQDVFSIGDLIFGEATLKSIHADKVEIDRHGSIEVLILDEKLAARGSDESDESSSSHIVVSEAELDKALENLPLLLTQARAVPYFKDGKSIGLRMFAIRKDSMFEKIGLKNGDILKSINDNSLGDITQAMKLFEQLKSERNLSVHLERNNEEKEFSYEIR